MAQAQCEAILQKVRQNIKKQLAQIGKLDKQLQKQLNTYNSLSNTLIGLVRQKDRTQDHSYCINQLVEKILKVQKQMDWISEQKIRLANSLDSSVNSSSQQMGQATKGCQQYQAQSSEEDSKVLLSGEAAEMEELFQECRDKEYLELCICSPIQKKNCAPEELMIMCDKEECSNKWFHLKCVGLSQLPAIQEHWICHLCKKTPNSQ